MWEGFGSEGGLVLVCLFYCPAGSVGKLLLMRGLCHRFLLLNLWGWKCLYVGLLCNYWLFFNQFPKYIWALLNWNGLAGTSSWLVWFGGGEFACAGCTLQFVQAFPPVCTVLWEGTVWFNAELPFISQRGVCGCERGYTEVMRSNGLLDYCVKVPGLEDKKADVKNIAGKNKPVNSKMHDIFKGWSIQPFNPGEKLKYEWNKLSLGGFCRRRVQAL